MTSTGISTTTIASSDTTTITSTPATGFTSSDVTQTSTSNDTPPTSEIYRKGIGIPLGIMVVSILTSLIRVRVKCRKPPPGVRNRRNHPRAATVQPQIQNQSELKPHD